MRLGLLPCCKVSSLFSTEVEIACLMLASVHSYSRTLFHLSTSSRLP